jgi:hypothetical protein
MRWWSELPPPELLGPGGGGAGGGGAGGGGAGGGGAGAIWLRDDTLALAISRTLAGELGRAMTSS